MSRHGRGQLASFGLVAVLVLLAIFAISAAIFTRQAVVHAKNMTELSAAYGRARFGVGEEESLERKYRLEPGPEIRADFRAAVASVGSAMRDVSRLGGSSDRTLASHVLRAHRPYLAATGRMFDAVDRHDTPTVLRIDRTQTEPAFDDIQISVEAAAAQHLRSSGEALDHSSSVTRGFGLLAPVVFAAGLALLAYLFRLRRREQRATEAELTRQNQILAQQAARLQRTLAEREEAQNELRVTQEQLRHAQRLESLGQLAGGVAHDFNNLLQIIIGYCALVETSVPEDVRSQLREVVGAANRGADLTRQLLAFGGRQVLNAAVWDVNVVMSDMDQLLERVLPSNIDFKTVPPPTQLRTRVDRGQLEQVLVNLVMNARDAMPKVGGTITLFAEELTLDQPLKVEDVEFPQGSYVRIAVRDTGCGMNEATRERAFEPFFTTKERGRGTGLGLAMVYGIVRQSGGFVSLDSTPGIGTEVAVCLPITLEATVSSPAGNTDRPEIQGAEQVLLVEDESGVRAVLAAYLRANGYTVLEAADGRDGLRTYREHQGQIDVVVTDIVMPNLDGWSLINELRRVGDSVPVIAISGYTGETRRTDDEQLTQLTKPFTPSDLANTIRRVMLEHHGHRELA